MATNFLKVKKGLSFKGFTAPTNPIDGDVYFDTIQGFLGYENGSWGPLGGGGIINYNTNPTIGSTNGYNLYNNGSVAQPTTGTGGTVTNLTFASTQTSPLVGHTMGVLTKAAANAQGEGLSYDFTIDPAFAPGMIQVSFQYQASANFQLSSGLAGSDSDIELWAYDTTNDILIPLSPYVLTSGVTAPATYLGYFPTNATSTTYRLIWHVATTNASAWTFNMANVVITPNVSAPSAFTKAPIVTQFAYTGTTVNYVVPGNLLYLRIRAVGAGGGGGSSLASGGGGSGGYFEGYFYNLSPGTTIPIYVGAANGQSTTLGGQINLTCTGGNNGNSSGGSTSASGGAGGTVTGSPTVPNNVIVLNGGTGAPGANTTNIALGGSGGSNPLGQGGGGGGYNGATPTGGQGYGSGGGGGYDANAPGANGTVIIEEYYPSSGATFSSQVPVTLHVSTATQGVNTGPIIYDMVDDDNYGAYNPTTGVWTCPVSGIYIVSVQNSMNNQANYNWSVDVYQNGTSVVNSNFGAQVSGTPSYDVTLSGSRHVTLMAGDQIYAANTSPYNATEIAAGASGNFMDIIQILPPQNLQPDVIPIGTMFDSAAVALPPNYLFVDGSSQLISDYPQLAVSMFDPTTGLYAFGSADSTHFNLPPGGVFYRSVDYANANDPDSASRTTSAANGNTGNNIGSYQADQNLSHNHNQLGSLTYASGGARDGANSDASSVEGYTQYSGGNQANPRNVYVNKIIKYQ